MTYQLLTRHFFHRLFRNDMVDFEDQMRQRVVGILAVLAIFCLLLSQSLVYKYMFIPDEGRSWLEKCFMMTFIMIVLGLVAVLEWEVVFPDARDYANLTPLPVRIRTIFWAKFSSLFLFTGIFAIGMNALSTMSFAMVLSRWRSPSPFMILRYALAHLIANFAAAFFAFFLAVLPMGILMSLLGPRLFRRISTVVRSALLLGYLMMIFVFLRVAGWGDTHLNFMLDLRSGDSAAAYLFPPFWFTGLYEVLTGNRDPAFQSWAALAVLALVAVIGLFYLSSGLGYRRFIKQLGHVPAAKPPFLKFRKAFAYGIGPLLMPHPVQRAVFLFYGRTLRTSLFHRMRLATYLVFALGLILIRMIVRDFNLTTLQTPNATILSATLILTFFLVLGLRGLVNWPVELPAGWIFRLTEGKRRRHYFSGLRRGIFWLNLTPLFLLIFGFHAILWGGRTAAYHTFYGLAVSVLLLEFFFLRFTKIPFACSYLPGKEKIQLFWLFYLLGFMGFLKLGAGLEVRLLRSPDGFLPFAAGILTVIGLIRLYQRLYFHPRNAIQYEEEPPPAIVDLTYRTPPHKRPVT